MRTTTTVTNGSSCYQVGKKVADGGTYRTFICTPEGEREQCLLIISTSPDQNGKLDRWVYILRELKRISDEIEEEYARVKSGSKSPLNYEIQFPHVVDSFISAEQGGRRIIILSFRKVEDVRKLVPLGNLTSKDRRRVDLRTSVWIVGKLLKLLAFAHSEGIATELMGKKNILIEPEKHYVVIFDWTQAILAQPGELAVECQRKDIMGAAKAVLVALGGDLSKGTVPDTDDSTNAYVDYLYWLARGNECDAKSAHSRLYQHTDSIWQRQFYQFTTKPLLKQG